MFKRIAMKPFKRTETYLKYGFVITEHERYYCPRCRKILNAGPQYQPKYCSECGQKVTFKKVEWKKDRELGFLPVEQREDGYAPIKN